MIQMTDCACIKKLPDLGCLSEGTFFIIKNNMELLLQQLLRVK